MWRNIKQIAAQKTKVLHVNKYNCTVLCRFAGWLQYTLSNSNYSDGNKIHSCIVLVRYRKNEREFHSL